ncbi:SH3 domain-containing protein [Actinotalea sp. BY-33]|uniref:SH3 domain-containing protein n=1 Tax=Actinotalea soli TaxID=2819234 RepID=A0A939RUE0_9CELL|nr:GW dipeptide domain-containing protein [Actinotalea soli]MBO1751210.1 SH3 domain-containing protein [Actinotalea soli]
MTVEGAPVVGENLRAVVAQAPEGADVSYRWSRDGATIDAADGPVYALVMADAGHAIDVEVVAQAFGRTDTTARSTPVIAVYPGELSVSTAAPRIGEAVTVSITGAVPSDLRHEISWLVDGRPQVYGGSATWRVNRGLGGVLAVRVRPSIPGAPATDLVVGTLGPGTMTPSLAMDGHMYVGQRLEARSSDIPSGASITHQWLRDGDAIVGATGRLYTVTEEDTGRAISVSATFRAWEYESATVTTPARLVDPSVISADVRIAGHPRYQSSLEAAVDVYPRTSTATYQWLRDGQPIAGATSDSYVPELADIGHGVAVRATFDAPGAATSRVTSDSLTVRRGVIVGRSQVENGAFVGGTLRQQSLSRPAGASRTYQWLRDGQPIPGATLETYELTVADFRTGVSLRTTYTLEGYDDAVATSPTVKVEPGEMSAMIDHTGDDYIGAIQSARVTNQRPADAARTYQWLRDGVPIAGASSSTYALRTADVGKYVSVQLALTHPAYRPFADVSIGHKGVDARPYVTVAGTAAPGRPLRVRTHDWRTVGSLRFQWFADGKPIAGATRSSYTIPSGVVGRSVTVRVSAVVDGAVTLTKTSPAVATTKAVSGTRWVRREGPALRTRPVSGAGRLTVLDSGTSVTLRAKTVDGSWVEVRAGTWVGWVQASDLTATALENASGTRHVASATARVTTGVSPSSSLATTAREGATVSRLAVTASGTRTKVRLGNGVVGWVTTSQLRR